MILLKITIKKNSGDSIPVDSVLVVPWPFRNPLEFHGTEIAILAGSTAKIPFHGIPGIDWILADSSRNMWGTVKNSTVLMVEWRRHNKCTIFMGKKPCSTLKKAVIVTDNI